MTPPIPAPRPFVLADVAPDGTPQAMLCTPTPETLIDAAAARALIGELLLVLVPAPQNVTESGSNPSPAPSGSPNGSAAGGDVSCSVCPGSASQLSDTTREA